jgi:exodeoxyribonuclease-1
MPLSYFFYDLETSGLSPRDARVMQFAGQRTDVDFNPIGEPVNILIKLTPDVLPEPDAVLLTGITPQQVLSDGISEAQFLAYFYEQVVLPDTIFLGYNSIRFDDEFMRFLHYRNFYDAYAWQWANGCSRWDMLDVVRMTRALRPDEISWPVTQEGKPTNRLELITKLNKLDHYKAHDALSDVYATIAVSKLIRDKQPKLFDFLLNIRKKDKVKAIVQSGQPFTYTSSHFPSQYLHTTAAVLLARHEQQDSAIVYDLRVDPTPYLAMTSKELAAAWHYSKDPAERLPLKTLKYNRCPALAPGVVQDKESLARIGLSVTNVAKHLAILQSEHQAFAKKVLAAASELDKQRGSEDAKVVQDELSVDNRLYEGFYDANDKQLLERVRSTPPKDLGLDYAARFHDSRLRQLLPLYKARNFPSELTQEERTWWDDFRTRKLLDGKSESKLAKYFARLDVLKQSGSLDENKRFILEELQLYGESIVPDGEAN